MAPTFWKLLLDADNPTLEDFAREDTRLLDRLSHFASKDITEPLDRLSHLKEYFAREDDTLPLDRLSL